jgi:hypothetical protein
VVAGQREAGDVEPIRKQTANEQSVALRERRPTGNEQWLAWNEQLASLVGVSLITN